MLSTGHKRVVELVATVAGANSEISHPEIHFGMSLLNLWKQLYNVSFGSGGPF